ncbi:MAG: hypothetical protein JOZ53_15410, partial [Planctomycetaceae bacterium]|nr:hypothetical protein [Planctomycetaceae bacterium]
MRWGMTVCLLGLLASGRAARAQSSGSGLAPSVDAYGRRPSAARLADAREVRARLGLVPEYEHLPGIASVKVAILDYGFDGIGT